MPNSARQVLNQGTVRLQDAGIGPARQEAEWLLGRLLNANSLELYLHEHVVEPKVRDRFFAQIEARASGIPLQYLLGEAEFFGRRFMVAPGVFIPRPETEAVLAVALPALRQQEQRLARPLRLLDLGSGSGCIAVTLACELPTCVVVGVELSWQALCVAMTNVLWHGLSSRIRLVQSWWTTGLRGLWDGIISNPPYVPSVQVDRLPLDVRQEPRISLDGGSDGLRELHQLLHEAPQILRVDGVLVMECGEDQVEPLCDAAYATTWVERASAVEDLAGRPRGVLITKRS